MFKVLSGDCREVMAELEAESVDAIVTDPPYELGFMGKSWDASGVAFDPETWRHALRVLKPGGHMLAFSGSRTYHRMACAIEDAGFEIRDQIMWVYGSGFPKSHNLEGEWSGWGTALKPAHEPIVVARKPFKGTVAANVMAHGTGALNIDGCRVEAGRDYLDLEVTQGVSTARTSWTPTAHPRTFEPASGRWPANYIHDGSDEVLRLFPETAPAKKNKISDGRSAPFMQAGGEKTGGFSGRHDPSNSHDDSGGSAARFFYCPKASKADREDGLDDHDDRILNRTNPGGIENDPKWAPRVRKNNHPTVKPTELMRYLCRLVTPPGGLVLDPFTGSGSTGRGAVLEGFRFLGIEMDPGYMEIAIARIESAERSSPHGAT